MKSFPLNVFTYRFRNSAGAWGGDKDSNKTRFTANNICDFMCHNPYSKETILMELKSTKQKSLPLSNIKNNQLVGLCNASTYEGVKAYFIINFREVEETYAIEAEKIKDFIENTDRKSIPIKWCRENGILIEQEKKKSRYRYNVDSFLLN
ncbi:Holliday junction resolvase RecU [Alkalithermobacter thermoalcaliphilus]|uniref:Holliday junction resolvase RecU n=1 Tax=Clostridium paradoxum TaxID=29346 RepID=UPI002F908C79